MTAAPMVRLWHRSGRGLAPRPVVVVQRLPRKLRVLDLVESTVHRLILRDVSPANVTARRRGARAGGRR